MLNQQQRQEFLEQGFTRLPGGLPCELIKPMVGRIDQVLEDIHGIQLNDSESWVEGGVRGIGHVNKEDEFRPFGSPAIVSVIDELLGEGDWKQPASWGQVLVTFPAIGWDWDSIFQRQIKVTEINWHTDYAYDLSVNELPGVQVFCLLADLDPGGGGTMVVSGSHRLIRKFVMKESTHTLKKMKRARLAFMKTDPWFEEISKAVTCERSEEWIAAQRTVINDIPVEVAELTGKVGDVFFTHPWLLHAMSPNGNTTPRMMCTQRIHRVSR